MGRFILGIRMPTSHFVKWLMYFTHKKCGSHVAHGSQQVTGWEKMRRLKNDQPPISTLSSFRKHVCAPFEPCELNFWLRQYMNGSQQQVTGWEKVSRHKIFQPFDTLLKGEIAYAFNQR